ncbi:hypothetical protein PGB90_000245 [Kerria lacca]
MTFVPQTIQYNDKFKLSTSNTNFPFDRAISVFNCTRLLFSDTRFNYGIRLENSKIVSHFIIVLFMWCVLVGSCTGSHKKIRFTVIAPKVSVEDEEVLGEILPSIELAMKVVTDPINGLLSNYEIELNYRDSQCSTTHGPLAAVELHNISADEELRKLERASS